MDMEIYRETFSRLHTAADERELLARPKKRRRLRPGVVMAAAALIVALGISAAAIYGRSVQELEVREAPEKYMEMTESGGWESRGGSGFISLQGYAESPEKLAMEEWMNFRPAYDTEGGISASPESGAAGLAEKYPGYSVYTQEMADALEKTAEKYGLKLHGGFSEESLDSLREKYGDFAGNSRGFGYAYADGTFEYDGWYAQSDGREIFYQFRRTMKGVLDTVGLNIGDASAYEQWEYKTACGERVLLAVCEYKALIFADLKDCFIAVNVMSGTETPEDDVFGGSITREKLEDLADSFDFSKL